MRQIAILLVIGFALPALSRPAAGDVFVLASGGRIDGKLANPDEKPRKTYVVQLAAGGEITLDAAQVKQVITARPDMAEYEKIRPQYPDTAEGQWNLAEWCKAHGLSTPRKTHLQRVIELDPEHAEARRLLGYSKSDGQWMTRDQRMKSQGYRLYKGQWKLPQEIELAENKQKQDLAEKEWFQKIKRWRDWLTGDRGAQGRKNLSEITDPLAVKALGMALKKDANQDARLIYVESLATIGTLEALASLAICSIEDEVEEVRLTCLDHLGKTKSPEVVKYYVSKLKDKDNAVVNRAGLGLGRMKDRSAIHPLIDALITAHRYKLGNGNPGQMTMSFPTGNTKGGIGMGMGGNAPKVIVDHKQNQAVLDALVAITGQNFNFDQRAWRTWYAAQNKVQGLDARRN
jgi:hypothetical protein